MSLVRRKRTRPRWEQSTFKAGPDAETTATTYLHVGNKGANHGHELFRSAITSSGNHADGDEAAVPPMPSTLRRLQTAFEYLYHPHPRQPRYGLTSPTPGTAYADNAVIGIRGANHVKQGRGERNGPSEEDGEQLRADGADGQEEGAGETQAQAKGDINTLLTSSLEQLQADLWGDGGGDTDSGVPNFVNPATTNDNVTDTSEALTNSTSNGDEVEPLVSEGESNATDPDPSLPTLSSTEILLTFDIETPHNVSNGTEAESTAATDVDNDPSFTDSAPESTSNSSALLEAAVEEETSVVESSDLLPNGCDATPMTCPDGSLNYKRGIPPDCVYPPCYAPGVHDADANGPLQQPPQDGAEPTVGSDGKPLWCPRITQLCDDGLTYVGLDPDTDCEEFEPCPPTTSPASSSSAGPTTNGDEPMSPSPAPQTSSPTTLEPTMLLPTTSPTLPLPSPSPTNYPTFAPTQNEENGPEFVSSQPDDEEEDTTTNPGPDQNPPAPTEPTPSPSPLPTRERNSDDRHNRDWKDLNIDAIDDPSSTVQLAPPKPEETTAPSEMSSPSPSQSATTSSPSPEPSAATTIPTATPSIVTMEPTPAQNSTAPSASSSSLSATPTYENTISWEPTAEPTQEPTRSKAELVGFRPPTVGPQTEGPTFTLAPTTSPVPTITIHPTATPAPTTLLDCLGTNSAYEYGKTKVWGDDMIATPVVYHYEVELIEEPRPGVVQNEVVPAIELAINQALLPSLFQCQGRDSGTVEDSGSADSLSIRARQVDGSPIAGITANPDDIVDQDMTCNSAEVASDACHRVRGELTLSLEGDEDLETQQEARKAALRLIRFAMERDDLVGAHPSIDRVIFIPMEDGSAVAPPTPTPIVSRNESPSDRIRGFPAIITFAILFLIAGIYMIYRGLKSKDDDGEGYHKERGIEENMQTEIEDDAIPGGMRALEDGYAGTAEVQPAFGDAIEGDAYGFGDDNYNNDENNGYYEGDDGDNAFDYYSETNGIDQAPATLPSSMPMEASQSRRSRSSHPSQTEQSFPSQANSSMETPNMPWRGTDEIQGNFSPSDGGFERSVSSGWGTPSPGTSAENFNHEVQEQEMSHDDEGRY